MRRELMEIMACPVCKGGLELSVTEENEIEVANGSLYCRYSDIHYPIMDAIPNLLPPAYHIKID